MWRVLCLTALLLGMGCISAQDLGRVQDLVPSPSDPLPPRAEGTLRVHYLDVGQGDATVWELPGGGIALYDCGGGRQAGDQLPVTTFLVQRLGLAPGDRIDLLVISHGHLDHMRECEEVLEAYEVAHVVALWYTGGDASRAHGDLQGALRAEGAQLHTVLDVPGTSAENRLSPPVRLPLPQAAEDAGTRAELLWPPGLQAQGWDQIARSSLVVRLSHGAVNLCFQGDIETDQERALAQAHPGLDCEVYLVGHHGSRYASSRAWLDVLDPELAVASFGENSYGHPTADALCRVQQAGAQVYATERLGTVSVSTDGTDLTVAPDDPETWDACATGASYWDHADRDQDPAPGSLQVDARAMPREPCRYEEVTVTVRVLDAQGEPVANATVEATWQYKTSAPETNATTNATGQATTTRNIGGASAGFEVAVEVQASLPGDQGRGQARFTPQDC